MADSDSRHDGLYGFEYRDTDLRRVQDGDRKTYEIKTMWQRHHEIVALSSKGFNNVDIARILGIHPQTVSNTLNSRLGSEKLEEIRQEREEDLKIARESVRILTEKALSVYHEIFDCDSGEVSLKDKAKAADTVLLELSGLRVPTKIQSAHVSTILSPEQIAEFKERGMKAARESGLIIDVIPEKKAANE